MLRRSDIAPSAFVTLAMAVAIVAIMIPTCVMVGCAMSGGKMFVPFGPGTSFSSTCGGTYSINKAPIGTVPSGPEAGLLALVAVVVVVVGVARPRMELQPLRAVRDGPPPPPEDPGDMRLLI